MNAGVLAGWVAGSGKAPAPTQNNPARPLQPAPNKKELHNFKFIVNKKSKNTAHVCLGSQMQGGEKERGGKERERDRERERVNRYKRMGPKLPC